MGETSAPAGLRPLRQVAWGLLLVVVDVRFDHVDLVPDPVGWLVALLALAGLARRHRGFAVAAAGCVLGLVVSVPDWFAPGQDVLTVLVSVSETVVVFATCTALIALVPERRSGTARIRAWDLGLALVTVVVLPLVARSGGRESPALVLLVVLAVSVVVVFVCFLVLLFRVSARPPEIRPEPA